MIHDLLVSVATTAGVSGAALLGAGIEMIRRRQRELELELAVCDLQLHTHELTGITNRRGLLESLESGIAASGTWSLVLCDLDRFKCVNDTHGHEAGDLVLVEVASRLLIGAGEDGLAAHLHGDEFALMLPLAPAEAAASMARIAMLVSQPIRLPSGARLSVGLSAGVAAGGEVDVTELLRRADNALYQSKTARGRVRIWGQTPVDALSADRDRRVLRSAKLPALPAALTAGR